MADMLVKLYPLPTAPGLEEALREKGITIKKALAPDMSKIIAFTEENGHPGWADEIRVCFMNQPPSIYIAVRALARRCCSSAWNPCGRWATPTPSSAGRTRRPSTSTRKPPAA